MPDYCDTLLKGGNASLSFSGNQSSATKHQYSIGGIKELLEERLRFNVSLGGFDIEPYEATPIHPSPQLRQVAPGENLKIPVIVVSRQYILRIESFHVQHYSAQAIQDLQISLVVGEGKKIFISGMIKPISLDSSSPVSIARETRILSNVGMPYTSIAKVGGVGFPDNFPRQNGRTFSIAYENDSVSWQVINQSDLYSHAVKLEIYAWTFPMQGRTKEENLKDLVK